MGNAARQQALSNALLRRAPRWQAARERAARLAREAARDPGEAVQLADDYRLLAHDVARARELLPGSRTLAYLENTYAQTHATLNHGAQDLAATVARYLREDLPAAVRWLAPYILWTTLIFVLAAAAGYGLVHRYPSMISLVAGPEMIASVESGKLWTEGLLNIVPSSVLSVQILANNIVVSLLAYCLGFLFGLGTLYILGLNGVMLGATFAFVAQHGLAGELFRFIVAHGCVELSVMCLSGAAGAAVGEALVRPGDQGRIESFRAAAMRSGTVLLACALLLVGAGLIEGFISPNPRFGLSVRVCIGVAYWILMLVFLSGHLIGRGSARPRADAPALHPQGPSV
ncbi:MAG TPA: stage II sporulation protein M [Steroidobacteraceae bacterium]|nr:stage II sporulation protein M [Steroidobacteraceae bacterium]